MTRYCLVETGNVMGEDELVCKIDRFVTTSPKLTGHRLICDVSKEDQKLVITRFHANLDD